MRTVIFVLAIASLLLVGSIFTGFPSPAQKAQAAQIKLQEAKISLDFAQTTANKVAEKEIKIEAFKAEIWECELAIQNNENHIREINLRMSNDGSVLDDLYTNRVSAIVMKNYRLKKRIIAIENDQSNWEQLKRELSKDIGKFGETINLLLFDKRN